jgi:hypothetical protein
MLGFSYRDESAALLGGILLFVLPSSSEKKPLLSGKDIEVPEVISLIQKISAMVKEVEKA